MKKLEDFQKKLKSGFIKIIKMKIKNYKKVYESNREIRYEHYETLQGVEVIEQNDMFWYVYWSEVDKPSIKLFRALFKYDALKYALKWMKDNSGGYTK